jgi:integrase
MLQWIVLFLLYTGARKREVLDARWSHIDLEQRSWRIPKTKSGKVRHVPLSEGALEVIAKVKEKYGKHAFTFIFANEKTGLPFVSIFHSWDAARQRAGLDYVRIHDLRHSFASFLVNAGRSLYEVQEILGHADSRTTTRYAHLSRDRLQEAVESVPRVI